MSLTASQTLLAQRIIDGLKLEEIGVADLSPDAPLFGEGLGLDSIDALELATLVERHYGIAITDMDEGKKAFASLAALDAWIRERQAGTAASR
jgi:acyl carrier protein